MAQMTEAEALAMLAGATTLIAQLSALIPSLVINFNAIKDGLASDDADELSAKITSVHAEIQALDARLQQLRT